MPVDLGARIQRKPTTLRQMLGLTDAEKKIAMAVAIGLGPPELPERLKVSRSMIGSQLASIFAETQTRRQSELVALLARVADPP